MKKIIFILIVLVSFQSSAQTTAIPDPAFEQELINQNIDSDGVVNGQVLTADIENITELVMEGVDGNPFNIEDLTGIEDFTALEYLTITLSQITELDLSGNVNLVELDCAGNWLVAIDVSSNPLLERITLSNCDFCGYNSVSELDLSNCPNINYIRADAVPLNRINLKNGNNNPNMMIYVSMWFGDGPPDPNAVHNTVCIEVDDVEAAQTNQYPYSQWTIQDIQAAHLFAEDCTLTSKNFTSDNSISIYPNPTSGILYFSAVNGNTVDSAVLYDISGRMVQEYKDVSAGSISVAGLAKGMYVVQVFAGNTAQAKKIIIE